jgi:PAS domain-containing protein
MSQKSSLLQSASSVSQALTLNSRTSPDAIVVINGKREIVVFYQQAEFLFGYDRR